MSERKYVNGLGRERRHRCNGCQTVFYCYPCPHVHYWQHTEVFCSAECEQAQTKEAAEPSRGKVYDNYLRRAGIMGPSGRSHNKGSQ